GDDATVPAVFPQPFEVGRYGPGRRFGPQSKSLGHGSIVLDALLDLPIRRLPGLPSRLGYSLGARCLIASSIRASVSLFRGVSDILRMVARHCWIGASSLLVGGGPWS